MDPLLLIVITGTGLLIWAFVLSAIIKSAVNSDKLLNHLKAQTKLLADMAIKAGSDPEKVHKVLVEAFK